MDDQDDLTSADDSEVQEGLSAASAQEGLSAADGDTSQDSEVGTLRADLEQARQDIEDAKSQIGTLQATKDREVRAAEARYQRLINQLSQNRSREERRALMEQAMRAKDDPEEAEALAKDLLARLQRSEVEEESETKAARAAAEERQRLYAEAYRDPELDLTPEERAMAEKKAIESPNGLTIKSFLKEARAIEKEKERSPMSELEQRLKALEEDNKALRASMAGRNLAENGGPEAPLSGGSVNGLTPDKYKERLRSGAAVDSSEVDAMTAKYLSG